MHHSQCPFMNENRLQYTVLNPCTYAFDLLEKSYKILFYISTFFRIRRVIGLVLDPRCICGKYR